MSWRACRLSLVYCGLLGGAACAAKPTADPAGPASPKTVAAPSTSEPVANTPASVGVLPPTQPARQVTEADLERVKKIQDREIAPFVQGEAIMSRVEPCIRSAPKADPGELGYTLSVELIRMGFPRLSDYELIRFNEIYLAMAATSRPACALLWAGALENQDLHITLAQLDDEQVAEYYRLRTAAGLAGSTAEGPPPRDPEGIELSRQRLEQMLAEEEWAKVQALLNAPQPTVDEACYLLQAVFGTATKMPANDQARTVRALMSDVAAEPSPLPDACLFPNR